MQVYPVITPYLYYEYQEKYSSRYPITHKFKPILNPDTGMNSKNAETEKETSNDFSSRPFPAISPPPFAP